jgi:hypothetical protein
MMGCGVVDFALKLPGFSLGLTGYLGGEDYLRYVDLVHDSLDDVVSLENRERTHC